MPIAVESKNWRELPEQSLEDLWLIEARQDGLPFTLEYEPLAGGFVPAIPYYLMKRFTQPGWLVYDPMAGAMVTARVGDKLARDVISADIACRGNPEEDPMYRHLAIRDARYYNPGPVDMIIWHPPYRDIIKFTDESADLSTMDETDYWGSVADCLTTFERCLKPNRMCAIVVGNKYESGRIVPLPMRMAEMVEDICADWLLKGWIVKDIRGNRQGQDGLQAWRAVNGDYFVFRHESILIYKKPK